MRRNAAAHAALAKEFGLLSSREVGQVAGSCARNTAEMASRWRKEGKIFAIDVDGSARFPGFCFGPSGRPQPAVTGVTAALGELLSS